jgi:hypothetical protein
MNKENELSILDELRRIGIGYEFSFAATYNAYLPFYEEVVLRRLASAGCRANVLMMDGRQCAGAYASDDTRPRLAGREYTFIPVRAGGAFHPKLMFLVGRHKGLLFVGSHNLTVAGFGHNRELTSRFEVDDDSKQADLAIFGRAWDFLRAWAAGQPEELLAAFDDAERYADWLQRARESKGESETQARFFGARPDGETLWEMVRPQIPDEVKRITLVSPFFDAKLAFIKRLAKEFKPGEFVVGIDPETVEIIHDAPRIIKPDINVRFVDAKSLRDGKGYLHAKAVLFETQDGREFLITGSANASRQAWLENGSERNSEAVIVTESSNRQSPARALGLKALAKEPALPEEAWREIKSNAASRLKVLPETFHTPLVAVETDQGFEIDLGSTNVELPSLAELIDANGEIIGTLPGARDEQGYYVIEVPDAETRRRASTVSLATSGGRVLFAIVHHTFDIAVSAQTEKQRELRHALANLDAATPMLEDMLKIVERVIFDDFESYQSAAGGAGRAGRTAVGDKRDSSDAPQEVFAASETDSRAARRRHYRAISSDDLALLLDALNRRLGVGLEASLSMSPSIARSEEELIDVDDEEDEQIDGMAEVDGAALARLCQRKTATLMRRMTGQLELAAQSEERAVGAIRQLAAVLGILHRLREVERAADWMPYDETFIRDRDEWKFFLEATRLLYSERAPLMKRAVDKYQAAQNASETAHEPSIVAGLLLWLAWDCALDVRYALEEEDRTELRENLRGMARLVALAVQVSADAEAQQKARDAISLICSYYVEDGVTETWFEDHMNWLRRVSAICHAPRQASTLQRSADAGDLIYPILKDTPHPRVVLQATGSSVKVVEFDKEGEQNAYGTKYIAVIDY